MYDPYDGDKLIHILKKHISTRKKLNNKAQKAHLDTICMIQNIFPKEVYELPVFQLPILDKLGILGVALVDELYQENIYVSSNLASFYTTPNYIYLKEYNLSKHSIQFSQKDHFMHIIAHEYGHHLFNSILEDFYGSKNPVPLYMMEACAFWFSDWVMGIKSPVEKSSELPGFYPDFNLLKKNYDSLTKISNKTNDVGACINYIESHIKKELAFKKL